MNAPHLEDFWNMADITKLAGQYTVDHKLHYLQTATPDVLRTILVQYRIFTTYYITDLALLVARLPFGKLRSLLSRFLSEELGDGDPRCAHPQIYDDFLRTVGVTDESLDTANAANIALLDSIRDGLRHGSEPYAIGLRGMGGECLCQIYLACMHSHFIKNPYIVQNKDKIDWRFWDIHTGDEDIHHREATRAAINELVASNSKLGVELWAGYQKSLWAWNEFWDNVYRSTTDDRP